MAEEGSVAAAGDQQATGDSDWCADCQCGIPLAEWANHECAHELEWRERQDLKRCATLRGFKSTGARLGSIQVVYRPWVVLEPCLGQPLHSLFLLPLARRTDESFERLQKRYGVGPGDSQSQGAAWADAERKGMGEYREDTETCIRVCGAGVAN